VVFPSVPTLSLNSLLVDSGANLTHLNTQTNLDVIVFGPAVIGTNGSVVVTGNGYSGSNGGPGAGLMQSNTDSGSGAGYGGAGGASASGNPGGSTYGSAAQPTDRGSRGGLFQSTLANFCQGGGAIHMRVVSNLTVNGRISANGNDSLFES